MKKMTTTSSKYGKFGKYAKKKGRSNEINPLKLEGEQTNYPVLFCEPTPNYETDKDGNPVPRLKMRIKAALVDDDKNTIETNVTLMLKGDPIIRWIEERFNLDEEIVTLPSILNLNIPEKPVTYKGKDYLVRTLWLSIPDNDEETEEEPESTKKGKK